MPEPWEQLADQLRSLMDYVHQIQNELDTIQHRLSMVTQAIAKAIAEGVQHGAKTH